MRRIPRGQLYVDPFGAARHALFSRTSVSSFERAFAREHGVEEAIALPHARVALRLILEVLSLPRGSRVAMSPVTIPEIVSVITMAGLEPLFVDLGERTCNVDCDALERAIDSRTSAILVTHLCGFPSDMARIRAIAAKHSLELLEDCSQVPGTFLEGRALGLFGRAGFFSLTTLKPVSSFYGGITITADRAFAKELRTLGGRLPPPLPRKAYARLFVRDAALFAASEPRLFRAVGHRALSSAERLAPGAVREFQRGNVTNAPARRHRVTRLDRLPDWMYARYSDFQASIAASALLRLRDGIARRRELSLELLERLDRAAVPGLVDRRFVAASTFWRFPLWTEDPQRLHRALLARGVDNSGTNLGCASREPAFAELARDTPHARRFVDRMLFLPMHPTMTRDDVRYIADVVADCR
jgi:dTDP-4-amino-4,6-dideoxygalactose transaminase